MQDGKCAYCGLPFGHFDDEANPTIDHVTPRSLGGANQPWNKVAACARCNNVKGDMAVMAFVILVENGQVRRRRRHPQRIILQEFSERFGQTAPKIGDLLAMKAK